MEKLADIDQLHFLLIMYDDFEELCGRVPQKTWFNAESKTYNILYTDGFKFEAPEDLIDILVDGAVNDKNPIIKNVEFIV